MAKNKIWLFLLIAVVIYLILGIYADLDKLIVSIANFKWPYLLLMIILTTSSYFIRFIKWNFFLKKADVNISLKPNIFVFFSGMAMIITPAKLGEVWKGWLLKEIEGEPLAKTIPVVIMDRFTDIVSLLILSFAGIIYYQEGGYLLIIFTILFLIFLISMKSDFISRKIIKLLENRAGKYSKDITQTHATFITLMETKTMIGMSILGILAWFFECLGLFVVVLGFNEQISIIISTFIFSFSSLVGAISMIPGGLGVAEVTISGLLELFGLSTSSAIGTAIIIRLGTLWYGAILGFIVYLIFRNKFKK
ncbi:lysylphosphatidylglycerol synthase transmembrane domain-containing protein [Methanobacterium movens]